MEPKPTKPGNHYGELSPGKEWFWDGSGLPGDAWIPATAATLMEDAPVTVEPQSQEKPSQLITSSMLQGDWIELYLTPVTGP